MVLTGVSLSDAVTSAFSVVSAVVDFVTSNPITMAGWALCLVGPAVVAFKKLRK